MSDDIFSIEDGTPDEIRKAFEEVTTRNVRAAVAHGNETRKLIRELEEKVKNAENTIMSYETRLATLQRQIATLLTAQYNKGTVNN